MSRMGLSALWAAPPAMPDRVGHGGALVEARGLAVSLGGRPVLTGVDVVAHAGELVALVGPNGAGKSTLLNALSGDVSASAGEVTVHGVPLAGWDHRDLARHRAVLPQRVAVGFPFTVEEVVRMGRAPWARTDAEDLGDLAVATAVADADIAHLAHRPVTSLSGGEAARTALARVLAQDAQLLLLDEPTASLDLHHQELTLEVIRRRVIDGTGAVVVLHDLGLAASHADRIVLLAAGHVVADGPPAEVLEADRLTEVYRHPIEVLTHPRTGALLVLPRR